MTKKIAILFFLAVVLVLNSCKKDSTTSVVPSSKYTPTCAYYSQENIGGTWTDFIYFFDLSDTPTSKKQYFVATPIYRNRDTLQIVVTPRSIDSLGVGFPSEITDYIGYGWVNQWTNASYRLKKLGGSSRDAFYKDVTSSDAVSRINFLNNSSYLGSLAGKWPEAEIQGLIEPDGVGNIIRHYGIFYFKEGKCWHYEDRTNSPLVKPISSFISGASSYDWNNVKAYFALYKNYNTRRTHYFLDFKNWRYFTITEGFASVGITGTQSTLSFDAYKSLDNLLKWPTDWGK